VTPATEAAISNLLVDTEGRRLTGFELSQSYSSPDPSVMRQITDKRKVVPARFIVNAVDLNPHKVEANSPGKFVPSVNFNRRAVA
jgi:hypothetical protein